MAIGERPGVYAGYEVSSAVTGSGGGRIVGIAARADTGTAGECVSVSTYAEGAAAFGADSQIAELIRLTLKNGAASVKAVAAAVGTVPTTEQYTAAFQTLCAENGVKILVCGSADAQVHAAMAEAIGQAEENRKYIIGIVEAGGTAVQTVIKAESLNSERMVLCAPTAVKADGSAAAEGSAAAAVAGAVAGEKDPAVPLNGAVLKGLEGVSAQWSDSEITTLVRGGVTPLENVAGEVSVVRGITTRTSTAGAADSTWREVTTTLIVDDVIPTVRDALRSRFSRTKNTAQTRGAIRTQVIIELENKMAKQIIDSYDNVTVTANAQDPTVCEVGFDFTVAHGLNQIWLTAHITV